MKLLLLPVFINSNLLVYYLLGGVEKLYKTVVIEYFPKADTMAKKVKKISNEMLEDEYELVTMSITNSAKAILIFKKI